MMQMNRWIRRAVMSASFASAVALGGVALAQPSDAAAPQQSGHRHPHRDGLLREALGLDTLSPAQRSSIEALIQQRRDAAAPVRSADAQVLTMLAQQVEQASIDRQALAPALSAEQSAAVAENAVDRDALNKLHALLTPAQRSELVDRLEARTAQWRHGDGGRPGARRELHERMAKLSLTPEQKAQIAANLRAERTPGQGAHRGERREALEAFRGDSFDAGTLAHVERRGERAEKLAQAMVPVLTPAQRATLAGELRARAARL